MFDLRRSVGKTIEIEIEEDDDEVIYGQVIVAIIGSVSITKVSISLRFLCPIQIGGDYIVGTQELVTVYGERLAIPIEIDRDGDQYGSEVNGTILAIY